MDPVIKSQKANTGFVKGPFIPLLGTSNTPSFIPMSLQLYAGDKFYIYSNDTIELSNEQGEKYGKERLLNVISSSGNNTREIIKFLKQDVTEFAGATILKADIAIAVLEYTPPAEE